MAKEVLYRQEGEVVALFDQNGKPTGQALVDGQLVDAEQAQQIAGERVVEAALDRSKEPRSLTSTRSGGGIGDVGERGHTVPPTIIGGQGGPEDRRQS